MAFLKKILFLQTIFISVCNSTVTAVSSTGALLADNIPTTPSLLNIPEETIQTTNAHLTISPTGKMMVSTSANAMLLQFIRIMELDGNDLLVGYSDPLPHIFDSFWSKIFQIGQLRTTFLASEIDRMSGFLSDALTLKGQLPGLTAILRVNIYDPYEDSFVDYDDGTKGNVPLGSLKVLVQLSNWTFCTPCADGTSGSFLEVVMEVKGNNVPVVAQSSPVWVLNTGGNSSVEIRNKVFADGRWIAMPNGYPRLEISMDRNFIVLQVPKFSTSVIIDMLVNLGSLETPAPLLTSTSYPLEDLQCPKCDCTCKCPEKLEMAVSANPLAMVDAPTNVDSSTVEVQRNSLDHIAPNLFIVIFFEAIYLLPICT